MSEDRLPVKQRIGHWSLPGDLNVAEIITDLKELQNRYPGYENLCLCHDDYYEFHIGDAFGVIGSRPETDEEYEKRLLKAASAQERKLAREAAKRAKDEAEFERLRKKLGK